MTEYSFGLLQKPNFSEYICYEGLFLPHEVDRINAMWNNEQSVEATVNSRDGQREDGTLRQSSVIFLRNNDGHGWIYEKLATVAQQANYQFYGFDIQGFAEPLQLAEYSDGDFFEWHMDFGAGAISHRKLSITVQLSDPDDYEGGELQFMINDKVEAAPAKKGTVVIFPSFVLHRVTPITRGLRRSIVGWVSGTPYR